jgi:gas vesicle protein
MRATKDGKSRRLQRVRESSVALALGASLLAPLPEAIAAKATSTQSTQTIQQRVENMRKKLEQNVERYNISSSKNSLQSENNLLSQWNNWRNY